MLNSKHVGLKMFILQYVYSLSYILAINLPSQCASEDKKETPRAFWFMIFKKFYFNSRAYCYIYMNSNDCNSRTFNLLSSILNIKYMLFVWENAIFVYPVNVKVSFDFIFGGFTEPFVRRMYGMVNVTSSSDVLTHHTPSFQKEYHKLVTRFDRWGSSG